jgi:hypothetical protein
MMNGIIAEEAREPHISEGGALEERDLPAAERSALAEDGAVEPARVTLFRGPRGVLRCTLEGEKTVLRAKVVRAFPVSARLQWINILDGKNKEVCLIEDPAALDPESRRLVEEELERFYREANILRIHAIKQEYRTLFWDVYTDRGRRDFVVKWSSDTVFWRDANELLLVDIDTNRFRIPDITRLDPQSRRQLQTIM